MKFETINKNKLKYLIPILVIVLVISGVFILKTSKAKYEYTKSYPLAKGTINYTLPDLNVIAMYQQASKGSTSYNKITTAPTGEHAINTERSYCGAYNENGGIDKDNSITLSYVDGGVLVKGLKEGTRCIVYFDYKITAKNADGTSSGMLAALRTLNLDIPASSGERSSFSSTISSGSYTYTASDDLGTSYYFAGEVNTNWVKIGSTYWRIIRINGNGTVRLIYSGTTAPTSSQATVMTGTGTQLDSKSKFNTDRDDNTYVGYMYGSTGQSFWANTHANTNNSAIKTAVDNWYSGKKGEFESYIDTNVGFCGDRSENGGTSGGIGTTATNYGTYIRLYNKNTPDLTCNKSNSTLYNNDLYTKTGANIGNKKLTSPVGLITADEVALAGGVYNTINSGYYLYTNQNYWTMSPRSYYSGGASTFCVWSDGWLTGDNLSNEHGVRPVINLKSSLTWSGKGTYNNPFIVS